MMAGVASTRSGGSMTISRRSSAMPGSSAAIVTFRRSPVLTMNDTQRSWPQIVAGRKTALPKAWAKWARRAATTAVGGCGRHSSVLRERARLRVGRPRVDDKRLGTTKDQADVLVEELVAANEDLL